MIFEGKGAFHSGWVHDVEAGKHQFSFHDRFLWAIQ